MDDPVVFTTPYAVYEAVERLGTVVKPTALHTLFREAVVGHVSRRRVRLRRHRPWFHNGMAPAFTGAFATRGNTTVLEGHFGLMPATRIFFVLWVGMLAFIGAGAIGGGGSEVEVLSPLLLVLAAFGAVLIWLGHRLGRSDVDYISRVIRSALDPGMGG